jgi:hypothetical protein
MEKSQMPELCLHIGMSKTATTWLQKSVFPRIFGDEFHDNPPTTLLQGGPWQGGLARAFRRSPEIWPRMGPRLLKDILGRSAEDGLEIRSDVLVSDQSAGPRMFEYGDYIGPHWERERMDPIMLSAHLQAMREVVLAEGFSALKVILVMRRQDQWLASKYAQRSDRICGASQRDFESRINYYTQKDQGYYSDGVILDYFLLWKSLLNALGKNYVLMLPYEFLLKDPKGFLRRIVEFCGVPQGNANVDLASLAESAPINVRSAAPDTWTLRPPLRGTLLETIGRPSTLARILPGARSNKIHLHPRLKQNILDVYKDGNLEAGRDIGFDLAELGYLP